MVNAKKLQSFIEKVSLSGKGAREIILEPLEPKGVKVKIKTLDNTTAVVGVFEDLIITEKFPIKNSTALIEAIKFVGGDITLEKKENVLFMYSTHNGKVRVREVGLCAEELAKDNYLEQEPQIEFKGSVNVAADDLKDISKLNLGDNSDIVLSVKDKKMSIRSEAEDDAGEISFAVDYYDCKGIFASPLVNVIGVLNSGNIEMSLSDTTENYPIKIVEKVDGMRLVYIVAPIVRDNEDEVKEDGQEEDN